MCTTDGGITAGKRVKHRWYTVRPTAVACGLGVFLLIVLIVLFGKWVHERWATACVRAAGGKVEWSPKGGYLITLDTENPAAAVLNPDISRLNSLSDDIELRLNGTDASDEALVHLQSLNNLTGLNLANTKVTDAGIGYLARLSRLWCLDLSGTSVTDTGISELAQLGSLRSLKLSGTRITEKSLAVLSDRLEIGSLDLGDTDITDTAVPPLARFKSLGWLNLEGTKVTADGVKALRKQLPRYCHIIALGRGF